MRFLTANEELEVDRLRSTSRQEFRIGSHFCGVQYRGQRPKYVMFTMDDVLQLQRGIIDTPDKVLPWMQQLCRTLANYAKNDS